MRSVVLEIDWIGVLSVFLEKNFVGEIRFGVCLALDICWRNVDTDTETETERDRDRDRDRQRERERKRKRDREREREKERKKIISSSLSTQSEFWSYKRYDFNEERP